MQSSKKIVLERPISTQKRDITTLCAAVIGIAVFVAAIVYYLPHRDTEVSDVAKISRIANLGALPSGYRIASGEGATNARSLWIEHAGAAEPAKVMVTLIEDTDPSGLQLSKYYSIHLGQTCRPPIDQVLRSRNREIRVRRTRCHADDYEIIEEQAIIPVTTKHAVIVYESASPKQFDYPGFADVLKTVVTARPEERPS